MGSQTTQIGHQFKAQNRILALQNGVVSLTLALAITALSVPISSAAPGDLNSINTGRDIQGGTHLNTAGSRTTFQSASPGGSLWLHSGDLVRGLEANADKSLTGNGGHLLFRAQDGVIRTDGDIDVSAVRNGTAYTGNGGQVDFESKYLFQNGNIFANGVNGGLVQFNVGGMTLGSNAKITAQGIGGNGGAININSTGTVDLRNGSIIDTSGKVAGTFDTNIINIEGSVVNTQGVIRADGLATADLKPDNGDAARMAANPGLANNPVPGPLTAGTGTVDTATMQNILFATPQNVDFRGGTIRLIASGQTNPTTTDINNADSQMISAAEKNALNTRNSQIALLNEGDVFNRGTVQANGALSKNGGTIIVSAAHNIINSGAFRANGSDRADNSFDQVTGSGANGGNGGTIVLGALNQINNTNLILANGGRGSLARSASLTTGNGKTGSLTVTAVAGKGGDGGAVAMNSSTLSNSGTVSVTGGVGGFGGHANTFDTEFANASNPNPHANAVAVAGNGAAGGQGGLVVFSGNGNPTGNGAILADGGQGGRGGNAWADSHAASNVGTPTALSTATAGSGGNGGAAGTIVAPNSATFTSGQNVTARAGGAGGQGRMAFRFVTTQNATQVVNMGATEATTGTATVGGNSAILQTRRNEYIRNQETAILFGQAGGLGTTSSTLSGRLSDAIFRTVGNPNGVTGNNNLADAETSSNFVIASTNANSLTNDLVNSNVNPLFFDLNTLTILNNGNLINNTLWTPGVHVIGAGFHDISFSLGGGHISWVVNGNVTNNQIVITRGLRTGGSTHVAATQDIVNNNDFINVGPNKALLSGFAMSGPLYTSSHAGSLIMKAGRDINNTSTGKLESNKIFFDIHPPLAQNPPIDWPKFLNGAQIGATVNLLAGRNLTNAGLIQADALTYRNGLAGSQNPALTIGGIVNGLARTGTFTNTGTITASGNAFFSPNEANGPRFNTNTFPATTSFNGTVNIQSGGAINNARTSTASSNNISSAKVTAGSFLNTAGHPTTFFHDGAVVNLSTNPSILHFFGDTAISGAVDSLSGNPSRINLVGDTTFTAGTITTH